MWNIHKESPHIPKTLACSLRYLTILLSPLSSNLPQLPEPMPHTLVTVKITKMLPSSLLGLEVAGIMSSLTNLVKPKSCSCWCSGDTYCTSVERNRSKLIFFIYYTSMNKIKKIKIRYLYISVQQIPDSTRGEVHYFKGRNITKLKNNSTYSGKVFLNNDLTRLRVRLVGYVKSLPNVKRVSVNNGKRYCNTDDVIIDTPDDLFCLG